jgi:hypothetical protein
MAMTPAAGISAERANVVPMMSHHLTVPMMLAAHVAADCHLESLPNISLTKALNTYLNLQVAPSTYNMAAAALSFSPTSSGSLARRPPEASFHS